MEIIKISNKIQNKGYKHYIDAMWVNRKDFIDEFDLNDFILLIKERIKEIYNFDEEVVDYYMKSKKYIE
jgi:hypothetical protein